MKTVLSVICLSLSTASFAQTTRILAIENQFSGQELIAESRSELSNHCFTVVPSPPGFLGDCISEELCNGDSCDECITLSIQWDGDCDLTTFTIRIEEECWVACSEVIHFTHDAWNASREDCDTGPIVYTAPAAGDEWKPGERMLIRLCRPGSGPSTLRIEAICNGVPCADNFTV